MVNLSEAAIPVDKDALFIVAQEKLQFAAATTGRRGNVEDR